jgi:hypothetical protein
MSWKIMKYDRMIVGWCGLLPIVADIPVNEIIWEKIEGFMGTVRKMGVNDYKNVSISEV